MLAYTLSSDRFSLVSVAPKAQISRSLHKGAVHGRELSIFLKILRCDLLFSPALTNEGHHDLSIWCKCSEKWARQTCHLILVTNDKKWAFKWKCWKTCTIGIKNNVGGTASILARMNEVQTVLVVLITSSHLPLKKNCMFLVKQWKFLCNSDP